MELTATAWFSRGRVSLRRGTNGAEGSLSLRATRLMCGQATFYKPRLPSVRDVALLGEQGADH